MGKYIKVAEREKLFIEEINKIGIKSFIDMADGRWDYYKIELVNGKTRYWKTKDCGSFESKLRIVRE